MRNTVVAILETGLRTATYKLATLMAVIEHVARAEAGRPRHRSRRTLDDSTAG
jgi:hypothetical protein